MPFVFLFAPHHAFGCVCGGGGGGEGGKVADSPL